MLELLDCITFYPVTGLAELLSLLMFDSAIESADVIILDGLTVLLYSQIKHLPHRLSFLASLLKSKQKTIIYTSLLR